LRSLNAQIEFLLRDAMKRAGRAVNATDAAAENLNALSETEE
jgi:hypothetical protein